MYLIRILSLIIIILMPYNKIKAVETNYQEHIKLALIYLAKIPKGDQCHIRFISFPDISEERLSIYKRLLAYRVHQLSLERGIKVPEEVSDRLIAVNICWYGWNSRAWQTVAERDPFIREPWILHREAESLRQLVGYENIKSVIGKDGLETIPILVIVDGEWFLRETSETQRSPSYYDLLYARFRFPDGRAEEQVWVSQWVDNYNRLHPGYYKTVISESPKFIDFPADIKDLEKVAGIDKLRAFAKETQIDIDFGSIVAGGRDDPVNGSIVALNNRLIVIFKGPWGWFMRTYDVFETSGDKDYIEKLIFKKGKFIKGDGADAVSDASEILFYLLNGAQAGFLINAQGKRVEFAVSQAANDTYDTRLNIGVRNVGSCDTCHAGAGGLILPRDEITLDRKAGIKRKFSDIEQQQRFEGFFEEWSDEAKEQTAKYYKLIKRVTIDKEDKFWTGTDLAKAVSDTRNWYDGPVNASRGAKKLGISLEAFKLLCYRGGTSKDGKVRDNRLKQLLQGRSIPSITWEKDVFRQTGFLLDANRIDPEYLKLIK